MTIEKIMVDFTFNYGDHSPRPAATPLFTKTRTDLIDTQDTPCEDCGLTQSKLKEMKADPAELPKVAHLDMELHHEIEWAVMQADGDLEKAFGRLPATDQGALKTAFPDFDPAQPTNDNLTIFLDGPWNAKHVLCRACHIAQHPTPDFLGVHRVGRHYSPSPNEIAVDVTKSGTDPEAPTTDTPAVTAAKVAAHFIAKQQGTPVEVHHPHHGLIHTAQPTDGHPAAA
ncbi:MAG: hypothetical protein KGL39_52570 [Patescibacteria group bacterium]|nr:hypothetical protein [Patescibacteria group bacterium]